MNTATLEPRDNHVSVAPSPTHQYPDPLDKDRADDVGAHVSVRAMMRVAVIAAETGARFARDGIRHDPMAWMLAPRSLFGGKAAIQACLRREDFLRATVMHGLGLGLDADRGDIDELIDLDSDGDDAEAAGSRRDFVLAEIASEPTGATAASPRLYTSIVTSRTATDGAASRH